MINLSVNRIVGKILKIKNITKYINLQKLKIPKIIF